MSEARLPPPMWYWVVCVLALLWMLMGVAAWTMDLLMDEVTLAQLPDAPQQLYAARPSWVFVVYAVAVFAGLLGVIALLLRRAWAFPILLLSVLAVLVQFGYTMLAMDAIALLGPAGALLFPAMIVLIGVLLTWLAAHARKRRWIA